jgi:hypothetical protein
MTAAAQGAVDPKVWSEALSGASSAALVFLTVLVLLGFVTLIWRGSDKLGIPGAGVELRLAREEAARDRAADLDERKKELAERVKEREAFAAHFKISEESDRRLRREFRVVMSWLAHTVGVAPPDIDDPEDSDRAIEPPPTLAKIPGDASASASAVSSPSSRRRREQSRPQ